MKTIKEITEILDLKEEIIIKYIENEWILPSLTKNEENIFDDLDVARIRLIESLKKDFELNHDSLGIVLSLIDQVHTMRGHIKNIAKAIEKQPKSIQAEIITHLASSSNVDE